jgi:hypothetical protein
MIPGKSYRLKFKLTKPESVCVVYSLSSKNFMSLKEGVIGFFLRKNQLNYQFLLGEEIIEFTWEEVFHWEELALDSAE